MKDLILCCAAVAMVGGCAIEGVGHDGRLSAFHNASVEAHEFMALNRGARDSAWYAGWCAAIEPRFRRMSDTYARVRRYCDAMQAQPESAESIRQELAAMLNHESAATAGGRSAVLGALSETLQQARQTAKPVHCTSQRTGDQVDTECR